MSEKTVYETRPSWAFNKRPDAAISSVWLGSLKVIAFLMVGLIIHRAALAEEVFEVQITDQTQHLAKTVVSPVFEYASEYAKYVEIFDRLAMKFAFTPFVRPPKSSEFEYASEYAKYVEIFYRLAMKLAFTPFVRPPKIFEGARENLKQSLNHLRQMVNRAPETFEETFEYAQRTFDQIWDYLREMGLKQFKSNLSVSVLLSPRWRE